MAKPKSTPLFSPGQEVEVNMNDDFDTWTWTGTVTTVKWSQKPRAWWYEVLATSGLTYVVNEQALRVA